MTPQVPCGVASCARAAGAEGAMSGKVGMPALEVVSDLAPAGDQPQAIEALAAGIERGDQFQTLLGITGLGQELHDRRT